LKGGNYTVTSTITPTVSNIELYGEGFPTAVIAGNDITNPIGSCSAHLDIICLSSVSNWYVHDLQFNGNALHQSGGNAPEINCVETDSSSHNFTLQALFVHNCKTDGIVTFGTDYRVVDNWVSDNYANGIAALSYPSGVEARATIAGNTITYSSDVGLDLNTLTDALVADNQIANITTSNSPWGLNTHLGIDIGDNGVSSNIIVSDNFVETAGYGIYDAGYRGTNYDVTLDQNIILNCGTGISVSSSRRVIVEANIVDTTTTNSTKGYGIRLAADVTEGTITNNHVANTASDGIIAYANATLLSGNAVNMTNAAPNYSYGVYLTGSNQAFEDNLISTRGTTHILGGLRTTGVYGQISGNIIVGNGETGSYASDIGVSLSSGYSNVIGNTISSFTYPIQLSNAPFVRLTSNTLIPTGPASNAISVSGRSYNLTFTGNYNFNPKGYVTMPFDNINNQIVETGFSVEATPNNATTMYVSEAPVIIVVVIGASWTSSHILVIKIDGVQVTSTSNPPANAVYTFALNPGETFYCQYQLREATFNVFGT
jgi:hypothetical protein